MSVFYVGQLVKVAKCYNVDLMCYLGVETMIVGRASGEWQLPLMHPYGDICVTAPSECLEPILPAGLESLDRINELYEPEPEVIRI